VRVLPSAPVFKSNSVINALNARLRLCTVTVSLSRVVNTGSSNLAANGITSPKLQAQARRDTSGSTQ